MWNSQRRPINACTLVVYDAATTHDLPRQPKGNVFIKGASLALNTLNPFIKYYS